ncbi:MAG TPA: GH25 family lysozyme [Lacipirellulaceae bacterium]|nr:GH25 family lysozyme [Lacipirellulaceae bacterium]
MRMGVGTTAQRLVIAIGAFFTLFGDTARAQRLLGLDVSAYQGNISTTSWDTLKRPTTQQVGGVLGDGRDFVIIRSSRGGTTGEDHRQGGYPSGNNALFSASERYDDPYFVQNINRATAAGLFAGAYHFVRPDVIVGTVNSDGTTVTAANTGKDEADHFIQAAGPWMRPGYLPPMLDFEAGQSQRSANDMAQFALDFSNEIYQVMGVRPSIYINGSYNVTLQGATASLRNQLAQPLGIQPSLTSPAIPTLINARWPNQTNPGQIDVQNGNPSDSYAPIYGPWDDYGVSQPWNFWQYASTMKLNGNANGTASTDVDVSRGDLESVKDQLIPAVWMTNTSGDWSTLANWNSGQTPTAPPQMTGQLAPIGTQTLPTARLPGAAGTGPTAGSNDTVILDRPSANITVTLSGGSSNIRKLYMRETLNITGGSLTINYDPNYVSDTINYPNAVRSGPISAQFSGPVTLSDTGSLSVNTLQVDAAQTFTWAGSSGTLSFRQINLMPSATTPANIAVTGDVNINPLNNATATISRGSGTGNSGGLNLNGGMRAFNVGNGSVAVDLDVGVPITNGGLIKNGAGTMRLSAANTFSGGAAVNTGTLLLDGVNTVGATVTVNGGTLGGTGSVSGVVAVNNTAHLAPGDGGVGTLGVGGLTLNSGSVLDFEFGAGGTADRIDVSGLLTLNSSALNLSDLGGFGFGTYALIHYGTLSGGVADMIISTSPSNFSYKLVDTGSAIDLLVTLPGDFNGDGVVDMGDYTVWRAGLGTVYTANDYDAWRAHFGQAIATGSELPQGTAVPETSTCMLLACAVVFLVGARRA